MTIYFKNLPCIYETSMQKRNIDLSDTVFLHIDIFFSNMKTSVGLPDLLCAIGLIPQTLHDLTFPTVCLNPSSGVHETFMI